MKSGPLQVGYVSRVHGLDGELVLKCFDITSDAPLCVEHLLLRPRAGEVRTFTLDEAAELKPGSWRVVLGGIGNRRAAEPWIGATAFVLREELPPPAEGEFFQGDLVGLEARDEAGAVVGRVAGLMNAGPVPNLVIESPTGKELLLPFADDFVVRVDPVEGILTVRPFALDD